MKTYLKECRWGLFLLLRGDLISQYVDMYGEWAETEIDLFRTILPRHGVCIEVGANIGMHAVPISKLCEAGQLFCYEPQRPIFCILCANLALNNRLNVRARHLAAGEARSRIEIETCDYDEAWNYGSFSLAAGFSTESKFAGPVQHDYVDVIALDEDVELAGLERLDLIKIAAEGFEPQVLRGAKRLITSYRPHLFVEANTAPNTEHILTEMAPYNYKPYWFVSSRFRKDNFNRMAFAINSWDCNIVFSPAERAAFDDRLVPVRDFSDLDKGVPVLSAFS